MRNKANLNNIDKSNPSDYPDGRIKDNTGAGDGTPVAEITYGDIHENIGKLLRLYSIAYNGLPDNETNGYQIVDALIALASKNDYLMNLTASGSAILMPLKVSKLKEGECFLCKVNFNKGGQTVIKGTKDSQTRSIVYYGNFKNGDYVQAVFTGNQMRLIRLVDSINLNVAIGELDYLKGASTAQEIQGTNNTVATTPLTGLNAFLHRVNGVSSSTYLANASRNGIYPKEHFSIIENLGQDRVRNIGFFSGFDVGGNPNGSSLSAGGDIVSAISRSSTGNAVIEVTFDNAMDNSNYFLRMNAQSQGANVRDDAVMGMAFKIISTTRAQIICREFASGTQSLKIHIEAVQL